MAHFVILKHPVPISFIEFTNPETSVLNKVLPLPAMISLLYGKTRNNFMPSKNRTASVHCRFSQPLNCLLFTFIGYTVII